MDDVFAWFVSYKYREVLFEHACKDEAQAREIAALLIAEVDDDQYLEEVQVRYGSNYMRKAERNTSPPAWTTVTKGRSLHQTLIKESAGEEDES